MEVVGLDHIVLNVKDVDASLRFYGEVLGLEVLRLEEFRRGEVGFVSVRVSSESLIDLRPSRDAPNDGSNVDHFCIVVDETDLNGPMEELRTHGVDARGLGSSRWGAKGNGPSFHIQDPDGNKIEVKSYGA